MGNQRKLNAILFELQAAQSPVAQAKIIARAWRTVRELSPTDRKLLARHAGFDGAEEILDGLAKHRGGFAPAMLLQMLSKARAGDGQSVSQVISALRDPERRQETIARGLDVASELLVRPEAGRDVEFGQALNELQAVEDAVAETPEEALAALNELDSMVQSQDPMSEIELQRREPEPEKPTDESAVTNVPIPPQPSLKSAVPEPPVVPASAQLPPKERSKAIDWERWDLESSGVPRESLRTEEESRPHRPPDSRRFDAKTVMGALGAEGSVFSQLRVLHREVAGFAGSSVETLGDLIEGFPDGWARRRALSALIRAGIPAEARDAVMLIATLENERDRSWCLGTLARRGDLRGPVLRQALALLSSEFTRRRLEGAAEASATAARPPGILGQSLAP